jgi:hypothetical protein
VCRLLVLFVLVEILGFSFWYLHSIDDDISIAYSLYEAYVVHENFDAIFLRYSELLIRAAALYRNAVRDYDLYLMK